MNIDQIFLDSAKVGLKKQRSDGSMPAGHNGPYFDKETPVRNTCHWLVTFLTAYEKTKKEEFLKASEKCIDYLLKEKQKYKYNYLCRKSEKKDECNGLIGPAWIMEALIIKKNT
jgi:hypothetical protein